jgi:hypothetical protein
MIFGGIIPDTVLTNAIEITKTRDIFNIIKIGENLKLKIKLREVRKQKEGN